MESKQWQKLPGDDFWIKCLFKTDSYSIWLTDLCQLYTEELSADDFRWRAAKAKIPIDIEEPVNLKTVLKTISKAIEDNNIKVPTSMSKSRHVDLVAKVQLPKPLPNMDWTFKLELQEDGSFRERVSKPLVSRIDGFEQREDDLVQRLQDKDHAIEKLLDTLDKYSVDLADVFPSLASIPVSRRTHTRRDAAVHLPALQAFDKEDWEESMANGKRYEAQRGLERIETSYTEAQIAYYNQDPREAQSFNPNPSESIKRTLGTQKALIPVDATSDLESKPAVITSLPAAKANGIKRSLGNRKGNSLKNSPDAMYGPETRDKEVSPAKSKGINTTLADRKKEAASGADAARVASQVDTRPTSSDKPNGISRTLGGRRGKSVERHPSPKRSRPAGANASLETSPEQTSGVPAQEPEHGSDELMDDDEAADKRRAALKRQFAVGPMQKTKKRKF